MLLINGMLFVRKLKKVPAPSFVWKSPSVAPLMQLTFVILLQGVLIIMFFFPQWDSWVGFSSCGIALFSQGWLLNQNSLPITIDFRATHDQSKWRLSSIYVPCNEPLRSEFVHWMRSLNVQKVDHWLFVGDFNFYHSLEDRNRPGGNLNVTLILML